MVNTERESMAEKAIVFDMDGVLFDTERLCKESWNIIAKEQNLDGIDEVLESCTGSNRQDTICIMKKAYGEDFDAIGFMDVCSKMNAKRVMEEGIPIKKGAKELLEFLKEENYKIGLASSTRKLRIMENLKRSGFEDYFEITVGGDMVEHSKPNPDIYLLACKELCTNPTDTFAVEDSPNGIRAAHRAGMKPILVPDLIAPTEEILSLSVTCKENLLEVITYLKNIEREKICGKF